MLLRKCCPLWQPFSGSSSEQKGYLGGDDSVVRVSLWNVGLCTWRGLLVSHVDGPTVHPVLFSCTLWRQEQCQHVPEAWSPEPPHNALRLKQRASC